MAAEVYVGVNNDIKKIKEIYVGVNGEVKRVIKGYVGVNGIPHLFWEDDGIIFFKDGIFEHTKDNAPLSSGSIARHSTFEGSNAHSNFSIVFWKRIDENDNRTGGWGPSKDYYSYRTLVLGTETAYINSNNFLIIPPRTGYFIPVQNSIFSNCIKIKFNFSRSSQGTFYGGVAYLDNTEYSNYEGTYLYEHINTSEEKTLTVNNSSYLNQVQWIILINDSSYNDVSITKITLSEN